MVEVVKIGREIRRRSVQRSRERLVCEITIAIKELLIVGFGRGVVVRGSAPSVDGVLLEFAGDGAVLDGVAASAAARADGSGCTAESVIADVRGAGVGDAASWHGRRAGVGASLGSAPETAAASEGGYLGDARW